MIMLISIISILSFIIIMSLSADNIIITLVDTDVYDVKIEEMISINSKLIDALPLNIRLLDLIFTHVDDDYLRYLVGTNRTIYAIRLWKVYDDVLKYLKGSIREIMIYESSNITDNELIYLAHFDTVKLFNCLNITDKGLKYLVNVSNVGLSLSYKNITMRDCVI